MKMECTFSMLSIMIPFTSATWDLILEILFISSGCSTQYCMCSFSCGLNQIQNKKVGTDQKALVVRMTKKLKHERHNKGLQKLVADTNPLPVSYHLSGYLPKFLAYSRCDSSIPRKVTTLEVFLDTIQECKWNLPTKLFISNNQICCRPFPTHKSINILP